MVSWSDRISDFQNDKAPEADCEYRLLCADASGNYALPFPCRYVDGVWVNVRKDQKINVRIVGWRVWDDESTRH